MDWLVLLYLHMSWLCSARQQMCTNTSFFSCLWLLRDTFWPICFLSGLWLISVRRCKNSRALCTRPCCCFLSTLHDIDQACSWASYLFLRPTEVKNQEARLAFWPRLISKRGEILHIHLPRRRFLESFIETLLFYMLDVFLHARLRETWHPKYTVWEYLPQHSTLNRSMWASFAFSGLYFETGSCQVCLVVSKCVIPRLWLMSLSTARWCLKHGNQDVIPKSLCGQHDRIWTFSLSVYFTKPLGNVGMRGAEPCQVLQTVAYALFPKPQLARCRLISTSIFLQKGKVINSRDRFRHVLYAKYTRLCYCEWQCFTKQIVCEDSWSSVWIIIVF